MSKAIRCCLECGKPLAPRQSKNGPEPEYCSTVCRKTFNNRRATRGAVFYDLFMGVRYDRKNKAGDLALMSTIARVFYEEDAITRNGRKSWSAENPNSGSDTLTEVISRSEKAVREFRAVTNS